MDVKNIVIFVVIVVLVILLLRYMMSDTSTLSGLSAGKDMQQVSASDLATSNGTTSQFTYSIWFFIDDWNYRYGEPKMIFGRMTSDTVKQPCPSVVLSPVLNNIVISLAVYPTDSKGVTGYTCSSSEIDWSTSKGATGYVCYNAFDNVGHWLGATGTSGTLSYEVDTSTIENIPIQKWTNLLISVYNRTLDVYMNGKLVKTALLSNVAKVDSNADVYITPSGGFSGYTSKFQYYSTSCDPQKAWNIYSAGYGGSSIGNMFNSYSVKVSVMEGDTETSSYTI
jgi:hypothetical protein